MEVFGFGGAKKSQKRMEVISETIKEDTNFNDVDPERCDQESELNRGEHYARQKRRSRYLIIE